VLKSQGPAHEQHTGVPRRRRRQTPSTLPGQAPGRDKTKLVGALNGQIAVVEKVLSEPKVPVHAVLCFTGASWGFFSKPFQHNGVWVTWVSKLAEMILEPGQLGTESVEAIAARLARGLPAR
jgi:hypothetical protein